MPFLGEEPGSRLTQLRGALAAQCVRRQGTVGVSDPGWWKDGTCSQNIPG
jgi:hypothetical protein